MQDDQTLMQAIALGNSNAFSMLLNRHLPKAVRFAYKMLGNLADAEDAAQDAFLKVWQQAAKWQPKSQFTTWFYKILYHLCIDIIRKRKIHEDDALDHIEDDKPNPEMALQTENIKQYMQKIIMELPEQQRAALALCYYQDYSTQQAADILGVSLTALDSLLFRARRSLRNKLISKGLF